MQAAERIRILGELYSFILGWRNKRDRDNFIGKTSVGKKTKSVSSGAITIPRGKFFTIAQVAEICDVERKKTVSAWLIKGLLNAFALPGLGQIVEDKELTRYLAKTEIDAGRV